MKTIECALLAAALAGGAARPVEVTRSADGSVRVAAKAYSAALDKDGNFVSLAVGGVEFLGAAAKKGGLFPGGPAERVEVQGTSVAAVRGDVRVEYRFDDAGFELSTRGGTVEWWLSPAVSACLARDGQAAVTSDAMGDVQKVVAGKTAVGLGKPYHILHGKLWPSHLCGRGGKPEDPFACRFDCGVPFEPVELLSMVSLEADGFKLPATPTFAAGQTPQVKLTLRNLGGTEVRGDVRFRVLDHPVQPRTVLEKTLPAVVPAAQTSAVSLDVPLEAPGLYWVRADMSRDGKPIKQSRLGLLYDPDRYRPPLTRPPDFKEFWGLKLKEMRAVPFDAKLSESASAGNERFVHYDLEITGVKGKRLRTFLRVPRKPGLHDAEVISHWGSDKPEKVLDHLKGLEKQPAGAGMWQRGADRVRAGAPQPEDSTYTRWAGRDDNNMLESYLLNVRMADYLRSRPDVGKIWMFGGSRSGASILAAAALSPERVAAVNAHVPTSCGLSWADKPYSGWGRAPASTPEGLRTAAYFDVTNFAPDLAVPCIVDGGLYDDLSPAPGILAFHNWAEKPPFKRCSLELGGHGFFPPGNRQRAEKELEEFLKK